MSQSLGQLIQDMAKLEERVQTVEHLWIPLLKKYLRHVLQCEGTSFVEERPERSDVQFTAEEQTILRNLEREILQEGL